MAAKFVIPNSEIETIEVYPTNTRSNLVESQVVIHKPDLFQNGRPEEGGLYDAHMGTTDLAWNCDTCGRNAQFCPGHYGRIELNYPVFSPFYMKTIINYLKIICFNCGKLILNYKPLRNLISTKIINHVVKNARLGSSKQQHCVHCGHVHPAIEKDKNDNVTILTKTYKKADNGKDEVVDEIAVLRPHIVLSIFNKISNETLAILNQDIRCHPKNLIYRVLRVPPNCVRPDMKKIDNKRSNSNDATIYLQSIVNMNKDISPMEYQGKKISDEVDKKIYTLTLAVYEFIRGSQGINPNKITLLSSSKKKLTSISSRWPNKYGRIRRNLNGRRVTYMARSYITCDPTLRPTEISLPIQAAMIITIKMVVSEYNYKEAMIYFTNGSKVYPGANTIKVQGKITRDVDIYNKSHKLEYGDHLFRHVINGDIINFNRAPSLESSSITSFKVKVDCVGRTIGMNVLICALFNADFDGDAMNVIFARSERTMNEINNLSGINNFFISYSSGGPKIGLVQDSTSAMPELTKSETKIDKFYAMQLFNRCNNNINLKGLPNLIDGRDITTILFESLNLSINYTQKSQMYDPVHAEYIHFEESDRMVKIQNGKHLSGVLDKSSIGDSNGSIFHIINNQYDSFRALDVMYQMQQISLESQLNIGLSVSVRDFLIPQASLDKIHEIENKILLQSYQITDRLNAGQLIPPLGVSIDEYYEEQQKNELRADDELLAHILCNINPKYNQLYKMFMYGAKGKFENFRSITSALGQLLPAGDRIPLSLGKKRSSVHYTVDDPDPAARGYVGNSYISGLDMSEFVFHCMNDRYNLIVMALQTAITGTFNREAVKNFESMVVNNMRQVVNDNKIIQLLFGGDGVDTRSVYNIVMPTVAPNLDMEKYHVLVKELEKKYQNSNLQARLDKEFNQLKEDRDVFMKNAIRWANINGQAYDQRTQLPTNIKSLIENVLENFRDKVDNYFNPIECMDIVEELCRYIPYILVNDIQYKKKAKLPEYYHRALRTTIFACRSFLCTRSLLEKGIGTKILKIICEEIKSKILHSLMNYGRSVGILSAQAYSEPLTQLVLNSKNNVASSTNNVRTGVYRVNEILGVKEAADMKFPSMELRLLEEFATDKFKAYEVINRIEMMRFKDFILTAQIYFEEYKKPVHPETKHEVQLIAEFEEYNSQKPPSNLINYCIRLKLNKYKLIEKQISVISIYKKIRAKLPYLYLVYTPDTAEALIMRIYISNAYIKDRLNIKPQLKKLLEEIESIILRGIDGIINARINEFTNVYYENSVVKERKEYRIFTTGVNIPEILRVPYLDHRYMQTDSIMDNFRFLDIAAARNRIIIDLRSQTSTPNFRHLTIYADEMTYTGKPTSVDRHGSTRRNKSFMLRISDASPKEVIETASVNAMSDSINGVSAPIMMGRNPNIGVLYNTFLIDPEFITDDKEDLDNLIDEL